MKEKEKITKCPVCGKKFIKYRSFHRFCSEECQLKKYYKDHGTISERLKNYHRKKDRAVRNKEYYLKNKHKKPYLAKYGFALKEYNRLLEQQNHRCAICGHVFEKSLHVDHNHKTGKIRGLLCKKCNSILGYANDNSLILIKATKYLIKSEKTE